MEVYIEYVITDNFIIDYFLLSLALKYSKAQVNKKRIALSAAIGTIVAVLMPIFNASAAIKFFIKIALAFVMIIVAAKPKSGRGYFLSLCLFLIFYQTVTANLYSTGNLFRLWLACSRRLRRRIFSASGWSRSTVVFLRTILPRCAARSIL